MKSALIMTLFSLTTLASGSSLLDFSEQECPAKLESRRDSVNQYAFLISNIDFGYLQKEKKCRVTGFLVDKPKPTYGHFTHPLPSTFENMSLKDCEKILASKSDFLKMTFRPSSRKVCQVQIISIEAQAKESEKFEKFKDLAYRENKRTYKERLLEFKNTPFKNDSIKKLALPSGELFKDGKGKLISFFDAGIMPASTYERVLSLGAVNFQTSAWPKAQLDVQALAGAGLGIQDEGGSFIDDFELFHFRSMKTYEATGMGVVFRNSGVSSCENTSFKTAAEFKFRIKEPYKEGEKKKKTIESGYVVLLPKGFSITKLADKSLIKKIGKFLETQKDFEFYSEYPKSFLQVSYFDKTFYLFFVGGESSAYYKAFYKNSKGFSFFDDYFLFDEGCV